MMSMRRLMPFTIVMLLVMQTTALNFVTPAEAASGRGGTNDDFTVKSITIGNASVSADQWVQSDGSVVDYIFVDQTIEVTVAVQRYGQSSQEGRKAALGRSGLDTSLGLVASVTPW